MIFLDVNVPMYAGGSAHRLKQPCLAVLVLAQVNPSVFITNTEVFQELIHRYVSIRRWARGREIFREFSELMEERVEPLLLADVKLASLLADEFSSLGARDLVHAATMQRLGIRQIASTDPGFDSLPDIERLDPMKVDEWSDSVTA